MSGRRNTVVAIGIVSLAAAVTSGWIASRPTAVVSDARRGTVQTTAEKPSTTTTAQANEQVDEEPQPQPVPRTQALRDLLIDAGPEGYVELTSGAGPSGDFDLESFVRQSATPELDRAVLSENQFRRGHVRSWQRLFADGPHRIVASVFEFDDVSHAVVFLLHKRDRTIAEDGGERIQVESGIGVRFVHRVDGNDVYGYTVAFHEGNRVYYLGALYPSEQPPEEIRALEARQRELLARSADQT
jgi:hypothetical protein